MYDIIQSCFEVSIWERIGMMKATERYPGIYQREIPLKGNPLKAINIFIVKTEERNMIVDTGFNTPEIIEEMKDYIEELDLDLSRTILFLTHLHSDHTGLATWFDQQGVPIYMSEVDGELVLRMRDKEGPDWQEMIKNAHAQGLDEDNLDIEDHPGFKFRPKEVFNYTAVKPKDILKVGEFTFEIFDEEGHTPGMVGLYDREKGILFCGDHLLGKITPNITHWGFQYGDSLGIYLKNLEKMKDMDIKYLFSSHRQLIEDIPGRIEELKAHHRKRLDEAREVLRKKGKATVRDVTVGLQWDIRAKNWDEFPKSQKWFAAGEGQAHLEHLRALGEADFSVDEEGVMHYFLINP